MIETPVERPARAATPSLRWPEGLALRRPAPDDPRRRVQAVDVVSGRKWLVDPSLLARAADGRAGSGQAAACSRWLDGIAHDARAAETRIFREWRARGWDAAASYYVASRAWRYADSTDGDGEVRTRVLERFLGDSEPHHTALDEWPQQPLPRPPHPAADDGVFESLGALLWHGLVGVRERRAREQRSDPLSYLDSFGSAWDFSLTVHAVEGLAPGAYRYDVCAHRVHAVNPGVDRAIVGSDVALERALFTFGFVANADVYGWRYRHEHALRRLYLESGYIAEGLAALGAACGLRSQLALPQRDGEFLALHGYDPLCHVAVCTLTIAAAQGGEGVTC
jgi:hypothetical protein